MINTKKNNTGEIKLSAFGLTLNVNPKQLLRMTMNDNSKRILDNLIESKFRHSLKEFEAWYDENFKLYNKFYVENFAELNEEYKYKTHVDCIQDIADITRNLLPLHSDGEIIHLSEKEEEIIETAYQFWKYNIFYGYEDSKETEIK